MSIRPIIHAPNNILSTPSEAVLDPTSAEIKRIVIDMKDTVIASTGVGLAAPQIGVPLRIIVINYENEPYAIINPKITWQSGVTSTLEEGCLSVPEYFIKITRPKKIIVAGINEEGTPVEIKANDMQAKIFQHEIDHINGILITDYLKSKILF
jgi:peptide deformylase